MRHSFVRLRDTAVTAGLAVLFATCDRDATGPTPLVPDDDSQAPAHIASGAPGDPILLIGASDIASCSGSGDEATAALLGAYPDAAFFTTGDNVENGTAAEFTSCFGSSWGSFKDRIRPALGERDNRTAQAAAYYDYFGAAAGTPGQGYYSYDLGPWHVVVLNSSISMAAGGPQEQWLRADLAASTADCTVAFWHFPRFFSSRPWDEGSSTSRPGPEPIWQALYDHHAELVINGDNRNYERFAPQRPDGVADPARGLREIVVGTGGQGLVSRREVVANNSEVWDNSTLGVLKLMLEEGRYSWEFVPIAGGTFTDSGSGLCHGPVDPGNTPPVADAGGPYTGAEGAAISFNGLASSDPDGDSISYAWTFGDGNTGIGSQPVHAYSDGGSYNVTLVVTDSSGAVSAPDSSTVVVSNVAPTVEAGPDGAVTLPTEYALAATFSDPGTGDSPWTYTIDWGDGSAPTNGSLSDRTSPITASHAYAVAGGYRVRVSVTDKDGVVGLDSLTVTANPAVATGPFSFIATGYHHSCALTPGGDAYCWGFNSHRGQLGNGTYNNSTVPVQVVGGLSFKFIAGGAHHTCAITTNNDAYCWGLNDNGQLGDGTFTNTNRPVRVLGGEKFTSITAGAFFTCALNTEGRVFCWGANDRGQLGDDGRTSRSNHPIPVVGGFTFAHLRAGYFHSCGIIADGTAYCWGKNSDGQLGDGTRTDRRRPTLVSGGHVFASITTGATADGGQNHTCAVTTSNVAYCWGDNWHNQLGVDDTRGVRTVPERVRNLPAVNQVITGGDHSCAITPFGEAWCWGDNLKGQLGIGGNRVDFVIATQVVGGHSFAMLSLGWTHSCGVTTTGDAYCWGYNHRGQVGDGTTTMRIRPIKVVFPGST